MRLKAVITCAFLYAALCWAALSSLPVLDMSPGCFLALFFTSLLLGFLLIVVQVNDNGGDDGRQIVTLSGKIIPAVRENPDREKAERGLESWAEAGKIIFFLLSIFLLVFWFRLSFRGFPKEWWDRGYSLLIFMYSFGQAGRELSNGRGVKAVLALLYIQYPYLLSLPYAWFIYWSLRGRRMLSEFMDYE